MAKNQKSITNRALLLEQTIDTKLKFSLSPIQTNQLAYEQWIQALRCLLTFPEGIPNEFRSQIWLNMAEHYLKSKDISWNTIKKSCFNETTNPDDYDLDAQILKDLHRTNSTGLSKSSLSFEERLMLKKVLLAFARWNKNIGYCQGLNVIAALIIDVMHRNEEHALKVMIFLIESILPPRYYSNNLTGLTVDMSVFRDLLLVRSPVLAKHLEKLRNNRSKYDLYEPPLTNLFTMQWFITLFASCFAKDTVLRLWDCLFVWGSEVLIRAALVFWEEVSKPLLKTQNPDQFYAIMEEITQSCSENKVISGPNLIQKIHALSAFPYQDIHLLRDKYTYNITPFANVPSKSEKQKNYFEFTFTKFKSKRKTRKEPIKTITDFCDESGKSDEEIGVSKTDMKQFIAQYREAYQAHQKLMLKNIDSPKSMKISNKSNNRTKEN